MLPPLLAVLLCAAPDSASPAPVPAKEPSPQASSIASSPAPASLPSSAIGPLVPGSWGMGFRVLGSGQDLVLRRALSDRMSVGMTLGWGGSISELFSESESKSLHSGEARNQRGSWTIRDEDDFSLELGFPVEWLQRSHRSLRFAAATGPIFSYSQRTTQNFDQRRSEGSTNPPDLSETYRRRFGLGATGSVGMRWFFLADLALAADFGTSVLWSHSTSGNESRSEPMYLTDGTWYSQESWSDEEFDHVSTSLNFLGVGLEAWF